MKYILKMEDFKNAEVQKELKHLKSFENFSFDGISKGALIEVENTKREIEEGNRKIKEEEIIMEFEEENNPDKKKVEKKKKIVVKEEGSK